MTMASRQIKNLAGAILCIVIGILAFLFRESFPQMGGIDMALAVITGSIAGAVMGLINAFSAEKDDHG